jgi:hypothetical protein
VLAQSRERLLECYQADNGRPGIGVLQQNLQILYRRDPSLHYGMTMSFRWVPPAALPEELEI